MFVFCQVSCRASFNPFKWRICLCLQHAAYEKCLCHSCLPHRESEKIIGFLADDCHAIVSIEAGSVLINVKEYDADGDAASLLEQSARNLVLSVLKLLLPEGT